jgi:putative ubiquitin-RnfH superfamily antitoxin RatB of RatAB toxin-antitoxin module
MTDPVFKNKFKKKKKKKKKRVTCTDPLTHSPTAARKQQKGKGSKQQTQTY